MSFTDELHKMRCLCRTVYDRWEKRMPLGPVGNSPSTICDGDMTWRNVFVSFRWSAWINITRHPSLLICTRKGRNVDFVYRNAIWLAFSDPILILPFSLLPFYPVIRKGGAMGERRGRILDDWALFFLSLLWCVFYSSILSLIWQHCISSRQLSLA